MAIFRSQYLANLDYRDQSSDAEYDSDQLPTECGSDCSDPRSDSLSPVPIDTALHCFYAPPANGINEGYQARSVPSLINNFIDHHYSFTGRFDQQEIGTDTPLPEYPDAFEQLGIAATMIAHFEEHPEDLQELDLSQARNDCKAWRDGVPWSQYENACLVEEMSLHMRTRGESKIGGATLMTKMSRILNQRYGIGRSPMGVKNQWYRTLRERSGIDERGCFRTARNAERFDGPLAVSHGTGRTKMRSSTKKAHRRKSAAGKRR